MRLWISRVLLFLISYRGGSTKATSKPFSRDTRTLGGLEGKPSRDTIVSFFLVPE